MAAHSPTNPLRGEEYELFQGYLQNALQSLTHNTNISPQVQKTVTAILQAHPIAPDIALRHLIVQFPNIDRTQTIAIAFFNLTKYLDPSAALKEILVNHPQLSPADKETLQEIHPGESEKIQTWLEKNKDTLKKVTELYLSGISLKEVPSWLTYFPNLQILNLSHNSIPEIPHGAFAHLSQLQHLDLQGNVTLKRLSKEDFYQPSILTHLNLKNTLIAITFKEPARFPEKDPTMIPFLKELEKSNHLVI